MTIYKATQYALLLIGGLMLNITTWADDGSMLVGNCVGCHGPKGASLGPATPSIGGMNAFTFIKAMEEFRDDERPSTIMRYIAKAYTDEDFQMMADYFAKQVFVPHQQAVNAERAERGAKRHQTYCEKCHTESAYRVQGSTILAGQWMPYLQFTLNDFYTGTRDIPKNMQNNVQNMVKAHGIESLNDVTHFYGSQVKSKCNCSAP